MTEKEVKPDAQVVENETPENPFEKLSIQELEVKLVDAEQIVKNTKAELKANTRIAELTAEIKNHRDDEQWDEHKTKIAGLKEQVDELKEEQKELQREIDEEIEEQIGEKLQLESPYKDVIKAHNETIKQLLTTLESKGRVVEMPDLEEAE
ncbi:MAG: hypothetical protein KF802_02940 [Bdellovibrionaceae bacterium]|nr:hypothetical protein [Pseudobdellovibrionaceae bacterium]